MDIKQHRTWNAPLGDAISNLLTILISSRQYFHLQVRGVDDYVSCSHIRSLPSLYSTCVFPWGFPPRVGLTSSLGEKVALWPALGLQVGFGNIPHENATTSGILHPVQHTHVCHQKRDPYYSHSKKGIGRTLTLFSDLSKWFLTIHTVDPKIVVGGWCERKNYSPNRRRGPSLTQLKSDKCLPEPPRQSKFNFFKKKRCQRIRFLSYEKFFSMIL